MSSGQDEILVHRRLLFPRLLCEKAASGFGKTLCEIMVRDHGELSYVTFTSQIPHSTGHSQAEPAANFYKLFPTHSQLSTTLKQRAFENIVGKGENAGDQHFLLFLQWFSKEKPSSTGSLKVGLLK